MNFLLIFLLVCGSPFSGEAGKKDDHKNIPEICLSEVEEQLYRQVTEYRESRGLPAIPLSRSLSYIAQLHVWDLAEHLPHSRRCNLHSWSNKGNWSSCCYTEDHRRSSCMWNKPEELSNYPGKGYEIAYWTDETGLPPEAWVKKAINGWKRSPGHNQVITNEGKWKRVVWKAMGVGFYNGYAVVWFGEEPDVEQGEIFLCIE